LEASKEPGTCTVNGDCRDGEECKAGRCTSKSAGGTCDYAPIRFDFNEHKLSDSGRLALNTVADCMKSQGGKFTLEGHADERGTEEYNLQLSNRRAASVKRYLGDLGVQDNALDTVGFGENKPAVPGSSEDAWAANRRVEIRKR
jgi:peptidoglycan-associated lipoprotein